MNEDKVTIITTPWGNDEEKRRILHKIGTLMYERNIHECVVVSDAFATVIENQERKEVIVLSVFNFKDVTQEKIWIIEYLRVGPNIVVDNINKDISSMSGRLKDFILEGFLFQLYEKNVNSNNPFSKLKEEFPAIVNYLMNGHTP
jgi:hypothetical protein